MATVTLTDSLRQEYESLFDTCVIRPNRAAEIEGLVNRLLASRGRYQAASDASGVPWHFIAVIHNMEAGQRFTGHLHNGDTLERRTTHVPAGRPKTGNPPFTWEESAADALAMKRLGADTDWSLAGTLYQAEKYNGFGYRQYHPHVLSPYLWSYSEHYTSGKYVADGTWSDTAVSRQCGAAVLLRRLAERGAVAFADQPIPPADIKPMVPRYAVRRPANAEAADRVVTLQNWLSSYPGIFLKPDGVADRKHRKRTKKSPATTCPATNAPDTAVRPTPPPMARSRRGRTGRRKP